MSIVEFDAIVARALGQRRAEAAEKRSGMRYRWSIIPKRLSSGVIFEHGRELCFRRGRWFIGAP